MSDPEHRKGCESLDKTIQRLRAWMPAMNRETLERADRTVQAVEDGLPWDRPSASHDGG